MKKKDLTNANRVVESFKESLNMKPEKNFLSKGFIADEAEFPLIAEQHQENIRQREQMNQIEDIKNGEGSTFDKSKE